MVGILPIADVADGIRIQRVLDFICPIIRPDVVIAENTRMTTSIPDNEDAFRSNPLGIICCRWQRAQSPAVGGHLRVVPNDDRAVPSSRRLSRNRCQQPSFSPIAITFALSRIMILPVEVVNEFSRADASAVVVASRSYLCIAADGDGAGYIGSLVAVSRQSRYRRPRHHSMRYSRIVTDGDAAGTYHRPRQSRYQHRQNHSMRSRARCRR